MVKMLKTAKKSGAETSDEVPSLPEGLSIQNGVEVSDSISRDCDKLDEEKMNSVEKITSFNSEIDKLETNCEEEANNSISEGTRTSCDENVKYSKINAKEKVADQDLTVNSPSNNKIPVEKQKPSRIDKTAQNSPTTPVLSERVIEKPSNTLSRKLVSPPECNGNGLEVSEDFSVRSRYGRTHKPKPLTEGFLTTDRKVGAFLGHSPQSSPRKKDEALRLSLKNFKKTSPLKISSGEKLKAALESIKKNIGGIIRNSSFPKKVSAKANVVNGETPKTPKSTEKVANGSEATPTVTPPVKRPRGRPRLSSGTKKKICTYDLPPKRQRKSVGAVNFPDSPVKKNTDNKGSHKETLSNTKIENHDVNKKELNRTKERALSSDGSKSADEETDGGMKEELVGEDEEAIGEKESDSGVESSATAPPSEPEDGIQEGSREVGPKVPPTSSGEWLVGDLVWGHIKGHPFWPCIVIHEPEQGIYIKSMNIGRSKMSHFHVRFFGDNARRSWMRSNQIIRFTGSKEYLKLIDEHPNKKKDFEVSNRNLPKWKLAVEEAEILLDFGRVERLEKFASIYADAMKEESKGEDRVEQSPATTPRSVMRKNRKRPRPVSTSPSSSENESPVKGKEDKVKETVRRSQYVIKSRKKIKSMTPFDVFSDKHRDRVVDEFPDLPSEGIDMLLHQRWEMLDDNVKARYESHSNQGSQGSDKVSDDEEDEAILEAETEESVTSKDENVPKSETKPKNRKSMSRLDCTPKRKGLFRGLKPDKVCIQCEEPGGEVLKCRGPCFRFFHLKCAPENSKGADGTEEFRCGSCVAGEMAPCNVCWKKEDKEKKEGERKRCSQQGCGRCYHEECLAEWPQAWWSRQTFTCPSHCCHTCASDDPREARMHTSQTEKLVRCIRCPATYHSGDFCLPAGCEILTGSHIICQRHYVPPKKGAYHMNTSWCFICSMGGSLICCDRCPSSFHPQCLNITAPEGSYICEDCDSARYPLYGEVVWVKLGRYRWWPAKILYPSEIPENVQSLSHSLGEFAVRFFGSHDHYWVNNGRAFLYQEGDSAKTAAPKSGTDALFARALAEASVSYQEHAKRKAEWETANVAGRNNSSKPPRFVRIKTNKPVGDVKPFETVHASYTPCDCDPKTEKPCSQEPNCLNRMLMVECVPGLCRAGDRCCNQRFQKRQYPPLSTCRTEGRGWGLQTLADIAQGDFVVEYVGEMINEAECHRRIERMHRLKDENYYFLTIDKDHILDAGPKGNLSRFMNHSCSPNCETQKWTVGGETRVGLFALCDIPAGKELTFNYNLQVIGTDRRPCLCGAPNCVRFIGAKTKGDQEETNSDIAPASSWKKVKTNGKTPKRQEKSAKLLTNVCITCGHGGELVHCSIKTCGKGYHSSCAELVEEPKGKYTCPLHLCLVCGSKASCLCGECANLFCQDHVYEKPNSKRGMLCSNHVKKERSSTDVKEELAVENDLEETTKGKLNDVNGKEDNDKDVNVGNPVNTKTHGRRSSAKGRLSLFNES